MSKRKIFNQWLVSAIFMASSTLAGAAIINGSVSSRDNLFYTNWEGTFAPGTNPDFESAGSQAAQAFAGFDFIANGVTSFTINVSGSVVDAGIYATGPDGCPNPADLCYFNPNNNNGIYNYKPAYSVIGVWSTTADAINYISDGGWIESLVYIGSGGNLLVPQGYDHAYLFLAENDGNYSDNDPVGYYSVSVNTVPVPAAAWLFGSALMGLGALGRKRT